MIYLASKSPQRKTILDSASVEFTVLESDFDEKPLHFLNLSPLKLVKNIARAKLEYVKSYFEKNLLLNDAIFTADTIIFFENNTIYGKPETKEEAISMLNSYSGKTHKVATAIAGFSKITKKIFLTYNVSKVTFINLSKNDIDILISSNEWQSVAGGYRIQGRASLFIKKIVGSYTGVLGFPLFEFYQLAKKLKIFNGENFK